MNKTSTVIMLSEPPIVSFGNSVFRSGLYRLRCDVSDTPFITTDLRVKGHEKASYEVESTTVHVANKTFLFHQSVPLSLRKGHASDIGFKVT
jgi:hypothetical protein